MNKPARGEKNPQHCVALGVTCPKEAAARNELFRREGINARHEEFKDGMSKLVIYSENAEKRAIRELGIVNWSYGD